MVSYEKVVLSWKASLKKATDFDSWGQIVEAEQEYNQLIRLIKQHVIKVEKKHQLIILRKIILCVQIRLLDIQSKSTDVDLPIEDIRSLISVLKNLHDINFNDFPEDIDAKIKKKKLPDLSLVGPKSTEENNCEVLSQKYSSLLPKLIPEPGKQYVSIRIMKMGLKEADKLEDPFIQITCKDEVGVDLCPAQSTPTPWQRDSLYLHFNVDVELQLPLEHLPANSAVFFQLFHYKRKHRSTKVKCLSFMEVDELKDGSCILEIYKKNGHSLRRKKLELMTSRPLYLHLTMNITEVV